jgi:fatty acid desaturase
MKMMPPSNPSLEDGRLLELKARLNDAGCFDPAWGSYAGRIGTIAILLALAFIGLLAEPAWPLRFFFTLLAAFACVQAAFIAHDVGDGALSTSRSVSEGLRCLLLTLACGTSSTYFHHLHRLHHLSLDRRNRAGGQRRYLKNRYEIHWLKKLLAWDGRVFMIGTILLRGATFRLESIRFVLANPSSTKVDAIVLVAHYALWLAFPAATLGAATAVLNLMLITLLAGAYIGTVLILNHEGMSRVDEVANLPPFERVLATTRNLPRSSLTDALLGGVNNHIEHHLFPDLPTTRLPSARRIVSGFCKDLELPYVETSVAEALRSAYRHFKFAGRKRLVQEALS